MKRYPTLTVLFLVGLTALAGSGYFTFNSYVFVPTASPPPPLEGFYLGSFDSPSYLIIDKDGAGEYVIKAPQYYQEWQISKDPDSLNGYVFLFPQEYYGGMQPQTKIPNRKTGKFDLIADKVLIPAPTRPRDWDLAAIRDIERRQGTVRLQHPYPSELHRVDDRRMQDYMMGAEEYDHQKSKVRQEKGAEAALPPFPDKLRQFAVQMLADHPDDPYVQIVYIDSLTRAGDMKTLAECLEKWRPNFAKPGALRLRFRFAEARLTASGLSAGGRNSHDLLVNSLLRGSDLQGVLREYPRILDYDAYARPFHSVFSMNTGFDLLLLQVEAKVVNVATAFLLLQDHLDQAAKFSAATMHLGQMLDTQSTLIERLVGIAIHSIGVKGLQLCACDGCQDATQTQALWQILEFLNQREAVPPKPQQILWFEAGATLPEKWWDEYHIQPNVAEYYSRRAVAAARFQLVRMAAAARYHQCTAAALPRSAAEFAPLLPGGPPLDPFTSAPLHLQTTTNGIVCYSVGPDKADDLGAITYDPSNGTTSRGDITLEFPAQRKYPFPRGGVKARTREELLRQFPNGLPADPFADTRGKPLGVSDTRPVYVYSYGPDGDEQLPNITHPQVAYDPTNGTSSEGDLFIQIPMR